MGVGCGTYLLAREKDSSRAAGFISSIGRSILFRHAQKAASHHLTHQEPHADDSANPGDRAGAGRGHPSVTTWRDGQNPTGKLTRPNPVVRRGRK
jgi:hypothetical protein